LVEQQRTGAQTSPRYFDLADADGGIAITGWFESADGYMGLGELWQQETAAWKQHHQPSPNHVSMERVGGWETVSYDLDVLKGISNVHIRAEWVELGAWIDLHISVTTSQDLKTARAAAVNLLRDIRVSHAP
jgi:hypothetical protein